MECHNVLETEIPVQFYWRQDPWFGMRSERHGYQRPGPECSHTSLTPEWHHGEIYIDPVIEEVGGA